MAHEELTTLVCLFHHRDQAESAIKDLIKAEVPQTSISVTGNGDKNPSFEDDGTLARLGIPARDLPHISEGLRDGGVLVAVSSSADHVSKVERIFGDHRATKIDDVEERDKTGSIAPLAAAAGLGAAAGRGLSDQVAVPIVEEELAVGKRTVDQGGVRVYRRVVEIPVDESVSLREEHVNVERRPVDRAVTNADLALQGERTIELTETAEEAVIGKSARVVEEVVVGKDVTERTEHIHDTVRRTEVEVEQVAPGDSRYGSERRR